MKLRLRSEEAAGVCEIRAEGGIRSVEEPRDPRDLEELLGPHGLRRRILLDLQDAAHIDASGVSWLVHIQKRCRAAGGVLILHSVHPAVRAVLELLGMDHDFNLAADGRAARAVAPGGKP